MSHGIEVDHLGLGHILRDGTVRATDALRRWDSLSEAVGVQALARLVRRCVVDVALFGQVNHAKDDLTILRLPEVDVLRDNWVDQIVVCIALSDEFRCQNRCQLLPTRDQFFNVDLWRCVDNRGESIVHVFRGATGKERGKVRKVRMDIQLVRRVKIFEPLHRVLNTYPNFWICVSLPLT